MIGDMTGVRLGAGFASARSQYPLALHLVVEREIDAAYDDGTRDGWRSGFEEGYLAGFAEGFHAPDPPPVGSFGHRALERAAIREALWPTADTLADAIAAHLRDVQRAHERRSYQGRVT
jgi:hypothetical protein